MFEHRSMLTAISSVPVNVLYDEDKRVYLREKSNRILTLF